MRVSIVSTIAVIIIIVAIVGTYYTTRPAAAVTTLSVDTSPVKGEVIVDGVSWGTAPVSREVDPGTYTVSFGDVTGYTAPGSQTVTIASGEIKSITVSYVSVAPEKLKVAFMLPGSITDSGWNAAMYIAANEIADELNLDIAISHGLGQVGVDPTFRSYAERGYKVIFGWTIGYQDSALRVAPDFPDTYFIIPEAWMTDVNVISISTHMHEGAYLAGMVAAGISNTGTIAVLDGEKFPAMLAVTWAFRKGAERIKPDIKVLRDFAGVWDDVTVGREKALALIDAGADVILFRGDGVTLGGIQAVSLRYTEENPVYAIGDMVDQYALNPKVIVTSNILNVKEQIRRIIALYRAGELEPKMYEWGLKEGVFDIAPFHAFENLVPEDVKAEIDSVRAAVKAGTFEIPYIDEELPEEWG